MPEMNASLNAQMQADLQARMMQMQDQTWQQLNQADADRYAQMTAFQRYSMGQLFSSFITPNAYTDYERAMMGRSFGRNLGQASLTASGALAGYAAGLPLGFIPGIIAGVAVDNLMVRPIQRRMQQIASMEDYLESTSYRYIRPWASLSQFGSGFSFAQEAQITRFLRDLAPQKYMSQDDMMMLLRNFTEGDLFAGVRNVEEFQKKFEKLVDSVKTSAKLLGASFEKVSQLMADWNRIGLGTGSFDIFAAQIRQVASLAGLPTDTMMQTVIQGAQQAIAGTGIMPQMTVQRRAYANAVIGTAVARADEPGSTLQDQRFRQYIRNFPGGETAASEQVNRIIEHLLSADQFQGIEAAFFDYDARSQQFIFRPDRIAQIAAGDLSTLTALSRQQLASFGTQGKLQFLNQAQQLAFENFSGADGTAALRAIFNSIGGGKYDAQTIANFIGDLSSSDAELIARYLQQESQYGTYVDLQMRRGALLSYARANLVAKTPTPGQWLRAQYDKITNWLYGNPAQFFEDTGARIGTKLEQLLGQNFGIDRLIAEGRVGLDGRSFDAAVNDFVASIRNVADMKTTLESIDMSTLIAGDPNAYMAVAKAQENEQKTRDVLKNIRAATDVSNVPKVGMINSTELDRMIKQVVNQEGDYYSLYLRAKEGVNDPSLAKSDQLAYKTIVDAFENRRTPGLKQYLIRTNAGAPNKTFSPTASSYSDDLTAYVRQRRAEEQAALDAKALGSSATLKQVTNELNKREEQLKRDFEKFGKTGLESIVKGVANSSLSNTDKSILIQALRSGNFGLIRSYMDDPRFAQVLEDNPTAAKELNRLADSSASLEKAIDATQGLAEHAAFLGAGYAGVFSFLKDINASGAKQLLAEAQAYNKQVQDQTISVDGQSLIEQRQKFERELQMTIKSNAYLFLTNDAAREKLRSILTAAQYGKAIKTDANGNVIGVDSDALYKAFLENISANGGNVTGTTGSGTALIDPKLLKEHNDEFKRLNDLYVSEIQTMKNTQRSLVGWGGRPR